MRLRNKMLIGGAAVGAAATYKALAPGAVAPLENPIGGEDHVFHWHGRRISYTRRGAGPAMLLVHGIHAAAWSYEWRANVDALARAFTVHTIDLLGFGRSERPDIRYSAQLYLHLLHDFAREVVGGPCTLVGSSLAGAYAAILGARDPSRFPALVLICPTGLSRLRNAAGVTGDARRILLDAPMVGSTLFNALVSRASLRYYLERAYANDAFVTDELIDAYHATAHQPGARFAPAAFIGGKLNIDVSGAIRRLTQPLLLVWGEQAREVPVEDVRRFRALKPDIELAIFDPSGSLPHDEHAREFNRLVMQFAAGGADSDAGSGANG